MIYADHIEDDPDNPEMVIAYANYGTQDQTAYRMERAMLLDIELPNSFVRDFDTTPER